MRRVVPTGIRGTGKDLWLTTGRCTYEMGFVTPMPGNPPSVVADIVRAVLMFPLYYYPEAASLVAFGRGCTWTVAVTGAPLAVVVPVVTTGAAAWATLSYAMGGRAAAVAYLASQAVAMSCSVGSLRTMFAKEGDGTEGSKTT